jgi:flagellar M-ring protein FliF
MGVAALAVLGAIAWLVHFQNERDFVVLFSGLGLEDGSAVLTRLKEKNAEYRLTENGASVLVRSAVLNDLRLEMASAGLPKSGRIGFELFDRNNFGLTEFAEQVNYHRALEGELERTIMSVAEIERARVHITPPKDSVFEDQRRPAKASVLVKLKPLQKLAPTNVKAITHLVASAVEGLAPEAVAVLDIHGTLLTRPPGSENNEEGLNQPLLLYKRNMERDLLAKVNATLEPLLGPDRFRAAVSVDCDLSQSEQSEETFDPDASVMTTSQRSEETALAQTAQGVPGVPSNLPRPTSRPGGGGQEINRRTENLNFQTSRVVRKTRMPQGNVRRVSVSVLLDHIVRWEGGTGPQAKRIVEPPSAERIKATRDIVSGAVGSQPGRGDIVVVESLPFETTVSWQAPAREPAVPGPWSWLKNSSGSWNLAVIGALCGALVVLLAAVVYLAASRSRGPKMRTKVVVETQPAVEGKVPQNGAAAPVGAGQGTTSDRQIGEEREENPALTDSGPGLQKQLAAQLAEKLKLDPAQEQALLESLTANIKTPSASSKRTELLARHLADVGRTNPDAVAQIIRSWINDGEDTRL